MRANLIKNLETRRRVDVFAFAFRRTRKNHENAEASLDEDLPCFTSVNRYNKTRRKQSTVVERPSLGKTPTLLKERFAERADSVSLSRPV